MHGPTCSPTRIDVVIVLFHSDVHLLGRCLDSVVRSASAAGAAARVVFVDNGGGVPPLLDVPLPWVAVGAGENRGFGRAVNAAFDVVTAPHVLLLNPDAALAEGAIGALLDADGAAPRSLLAGTLLTEGRLDPDSVLDWDFSTERLLKRRRFARSSDATGLVPVEKVSGGALFARVDLLRSFGPFDERFFLYAEDADLSRRAAQVGVPCTRVSRAIVQHVGSASARSFAPLVEFTRADAAVRLAAAHRSYVVSLAQRLELLLVTLVGLAVERDVRRRRARAARLRALRRWGVRRALPGLEPADVLDLR